MDSFGNAPIKTAVLQVEENGNQTPKVFTVLIGIEIMSGLLDVEGVEALIQIRKRFANCEGKNCEFCPKQPTCFRWKTQK